MNKETLLDLMVNVRSGVVDVQTAVKNLLEMQQSSENAVNGTQENVKKLLKCDCAMSGSCVYEQMITESNQECRHKM